MARELTTRNLGIDSFVRQPEQIKRDESYNCTHKADELYKSMVLLGSKIKSKRPPTTEEFRGVVGRKIVSVASRIVHVIKRLLKEGYKSFDSMFEDASGRSEAVATFLALLELVKSKKIMISDDGRNTVYIKRNENK